MSPGETGGGVAAFPGRALHSRYNPEGEAERYVRSLVYREDTRCFLLIEPGLGYCIPFLRRRFPGAKIIALHLADPPPSPEEGLDARWSPGSGLEVQRFLEAEIPESTGARFIKIVEWRPARAFFGESYLRLLGDCAEFIKRLDAGERTLRQFGGRWFKNFFKNIALLRKGLALPPCSAPLLIAGAGPSLEAVLPFIRKERERFFVLGVSSALSALWAGGVEPDLLISTDGGNWALLHLYEGFRGRSVPALAASLYAALPSQCAALPLLFISDGSLWQHLILEGLGLPHLALPQRGTVSASALDLAFALSRGTIFVAGVDLAHRDLLTHARPYAFDRLWEEGAGRLQPLYTQRFLRNRDIQAGGSQEIYAAWFRQQLDRWPKRLYSLGGNNPVFGELELGEDAAIRAAGRGDKMEGRVIPLEADFDRPSQGAAILRRALEGEPGSLRERLREELGPLLFPGAGELPSAQALGEEIASRLGPSIRGRHG
jgi:hypothetical protein